MQIVTRVEATGVVTLVLGGTFNASSVADFDRALQAAMQLDRRIVLDLTNVRLIDRPTLQYLIDLLNEDDDRLVVCPDYVEHWIDRESSRIALENG
jgi:anti-anti-sigma regulatory factor